MHKLIDYVCREMDELEDKVARENKLSSAEVQYLDTLAHAKKNMLKCEEMDDGYSGDFRYYPDESRRSYGRRRDSMGRYSRRYSGDDGMLDSLRDLMESAPDERTRAEYRKFISKMENM